MSEFFPLALPQMGANDLTATIVEWGKEEGEQVRKGEIICIAETTKSVFDIEAPASGYLTILRAVGDEVPVGETISVISSEQVSRADVDTWIAERPKVEVAAEVEKSWTVKAEMTAKKHGIEIADVPADDGKITEAMVLAYIERQKTSQEAVVKYPDTVDGPYPTGRVERILIVGGGEGAVQVLDAIAKIPGQRGAMIVDDNPALAGKSVAGVPVVGGVDTEKVVAMYERGEFDSALITVSTSIPFRARIFDEWSARGIRFANVIHPSAAVGINANLGQGNIVLAFCQIGPCADLGSNNFLSAYCSIEHHSRVGRHCSFGPGVITSSRAEIGDRVRFGTGIFIEPHITIGAEAIIGSGCIIWKDVAAGSVLKSKLNYTERRRD